MTGEVRDITTTQIYAKIQKCKLAKNEADRDQAFTELKEALQVSSLCRMADELEKLRKGLVPSQYR